MDVVSKVSKLGALWVAEITKSMVERRNGLAANMLRLNRDGEYAKQHKEALYLCNAMLAAPDMLAASRRMLAALDAHDTLHAADGDDYARMFEFGQAVDGFRAAIAKADAGIAE